MEPQRTNIFPFDYGPAAVHAVHTFEGPFILQDLELLHFPFDVLELKLTFLGIKQTQLNDSCTKCERRVGANQGKQDYIALGLPMSGFGDRAGECLQGIVNTSNIAQEWKVRLCTLENKALGSKIPGATTCFVPQNASAQGHPTVFEVSIHVHRHASFYVLKVMIPVWLILLLSLGAFVLPLEKLTSRMAHLTTLFLVLVALQYVVMQDLPKLGHSTAMDKLVLSATCLIVLTTGIIIGLSGLTDDTAKEMNQYAPLLLLIVMCVTNLAILWEPMASRRRKLAHLATMEAQGLQDGVSVLNEPDLAELEAFMSDHSKLRRSSEEMNAHGKLL